MKSDKRWLLGLWVAVGLFTLYELIGVDTRFPSVHTISYISQHHLWLFVAIGIAWIAGGLVGFVWWLHHILKSRIYK